jgi:glyoxylase I family protein
MKCVPAYAQPTPCTQTFCTPAMSGAMSCRLDEFGIAHGEIKDASYGTGLSFRDPDNIALEFFAPPA